MAVETSFHVRLKKQTNIIFVYIKKTPFQRYLKIRGSVENYNTVVF